MSMYIISEILKRLIMASRLCRSNMLKLSSRHFLKTPPVISLRSCSLSGFKSDISLDKLYTDSVNISITPPDLPGFNGFIPLQGLNITYSSSTVGGEQTKVDIRFHVESATWLTDEVKAKIFANLGTELDRDGWLVATSDRTRTKTLNQADALEKLRTNIRLAVENKIEQSFSALEVEKSRKLKLKAARERLYIKIEQN